MIQNNHGRFRLLCRSQTDRVTALYRKSEKFARTYLEKEGLNMSVREFFSLVWLNLVVFIRNAIEFFKVAIRYYTSLSFLKADISVRLIYLFHNPYKISKRFLMKRGAADIYTYGETPLTTLDLVSKECQIGPQDCVYELGCGRGRTCFWLRSFVGCSVVGIEYIPEFVERANLVKNKLKVKKLEFRLADMTKTDYKGATVCYLYGSSLEDATIRKLAEKLSALPVGTKIITVSYPLTDYSEGHHFEVMKRFTAPYTWGNADVYLQIRKR